MAAQKPSIPKGTRDFSPREMARRNYIFNTIRNVFHLFGYQPIETPAMENLSTLLGKYGEEGDKLLFRILNSGDFLAKADETLLANKDSVKISSVISEKGLRYDLTVPFARYVVQHRNELQFPFKRYQIQPVWRADRPQKGRYREFYQCDADVIGSTSLNNEVELIQLMSMVFGRLGINVLIKINNRKVLAGIAEVIGAPDNLIDVTVAIDKIEKIGLEAVNAELSERGLSADAISRLQPFLEIKGDTKQRLEILKSMLKDSAVGMDGVDELEYVFATVDELAVDTPVELDVSLARGLNYYTGAIFEVKARDYEIGSITGGGRYDNLTGIFGMPGVSGVGISFGADRIYDVMTGLDLFPETADDGAEVMFLNMGGEAEVEAMKQVSLLRNAGVSAILYPDVAKMKKQMTYASDCMLPYVAIIGDEELQNNEVTVKNMNNGSQQRIPASQIIDYFKK